MQSIPTTKTAWCAKLLAIAITICPVALCATATGSSVLKADSNGNLVALWQESVDNYYCIKAATKAKISSSWTTPVTISDSSTNSFSPQLVVDAAGNAVAVWTSERIVNNSLSHGLYGAQLQTGSWGNPVQISESNSDVNSSIQLCIDGSDGINVLWFAANGTGGAFSYFSASTTIGSSWSSPIKVSQP